MPIANTECKLLVGPTVKDNDMEIAAVRNVLANHLNQWPPQLFTDINSFRAVCSQVYNYCQSDNKIDN